MLIDKVKVALRTTTEDTDILDHIQALIESGLADLASVGVDVTLKDGEASPKVCTAIEQFVRWNVWTGGDATAAHDAYASMKTAMTVQREGEKHASSD